MKTLNEYITEKFKLNSKTLNYYKFEDEGLEDIGIYLPFRIILPDQQESEEIYKIECGKGNYSGKSFWKFYDDEGNLVMSLGKGSIQSLIQRKQRIAIILMSLHGKKYGRTETIYIDKLFF